MTNRQYLAYVIDKDGRFRGFLQAESENDLRIKAEEYGMKFHKTPCKIPTFQEE